MLKTKVEQKTTSFTFFIYFVFFCLEVWKTSEVAPVKYLNLRKSNLELDVHVLSIFF